MNNIQQKKVLVYAKTFEENISYDLKDRLLKLAETSIDPDTFEEVLEILLVRYGEVTDSLGLAEQVYDLENDISGLEFDNKELEDENKHLEEYIEEKREELDKLKDKSITFRNMDRIITEQQHEIQQRDKSIRGLFAEQRTLGQQIEDLTEANKVTKRQLAAKDTEYSRWLEADRLIQAQINDKAW